MSSKNIKFILITISLLFVYEHVEAQNKTAKLDTLRLQLRYFHKFQFAGYYAAQAKGFYEQEGLYVIPLEMSKVHAVNSLTSRNVEYAVISSYAIYYGLVGEPIVLLKAIFQYSPYVILTLKKNNIRSPKDLVGKKLMVASAEPPIQVYYLLKETDTPLDDVIFVRHSYNFDDLINGKVDAATGYATTQPFYIKSKGYEPYCINPEDYGINFYGDFLVTTREEVEKHPERVEAFIRATVKGWKYAFEHVDEISDLILKLPSKRKEKLTKDMLLYEAEIMKDYVLPDIVEIGHINPYRIKSMEDKFKEYYGIKNNIDLNKFIYKSPANSSRKFIILIIVIGTFALFIIVLLIVFYKKNLKYKSLALEKETEEKLITESRLEEEKLAKKALLFASPDLIFRVSKEGKILEANIPPTMKLNFDASEIVGKNIVFALPKDIIPPTIDKVFETHELQVIEYETVIENEKKYFEARITLSTENEVLIIIRDITELKNKEKELKKSEEKFYTIFHNSPDPIFIIDAENHEILDCNKSFLEFGGFTREEVIGKRPMELAVWVSEDQRARFLEKLYNEKRVFAIRHDFRNKKGEIMHVLVSAQIIKLFNKQVILGSYKDITDLVKKDQELKETKLLFSKVFELAPVVIAIISFEDGKIIDINSKGEEFIGLAKEKISGKTLAELGLWERKKQREQFFNQLKEEKSIKEIETVLRKNDGTAIPCSVSAELIEFNDQQYVVACITDLSKVKEHEYELKTKLEEIRQLKQKLEKENIVLQEEINASYNIGEIITKSPAVKKELQKIQQVAPTKTTVLILGETGTGKELFARTIHKLSDRADKPLVKVNCAALPPNLIESELFGHEKGAFTGAIKQHTGRFELAHKGTIFLDEIGELPLDIQAKLLRVLQEGEFERVGSSETISVDVRIIAASNRNLQRMIEEGTFREDLFYRLNVFPVYTIPLRERREDIEPLVNNFIKQISARIGKKVTSIDKTSYEALLNYPFPGNIRELQNILERAIIEAEGPILVIRLPNSRKKSFSRQNDVSEKETILEALIKSDWKIEGKNGAAKILGMPPSTLRDKMKKYNLKKPN